jgi:ABC-type sulfate transport system permease subunit
VDPAGSIKFTGHSHTPQRRSSYSNWSFCLVMNNLLLDQTNFCWTLPHVRWTLEMGPVICTPLMDQMSIQLQFTLGNTVNVKIVEFSPLMVIFIFFLLQTVGNRTYSNWSFCLVMNNLLLDQTNFCWTLPHVRWTLEMTAFT